MNRPFRDFYYLIIIGRIPVIVSIKSVSSEIVPELRSGEANRETMNRAKTIGC